MALPEDTGFDFLHMELVASLSSRENDEAIPLTVSKVEHMGYSAGYRIVERLNRDFPRFKDELDIMKFICKEFWTSLFGKQIDVLRTNHQCVYVLHDNRFRHLRKISSSNQYMDSSPKFLSYTCGLVRGALANFGVTSLVTPEVTQLPACKFHVQIQKG
ncbi:unnamed protein product, partial [Cyprideis torosa]